MTLKDIIIAGKLTISEGGGGGGSETIASGSFLGNTTNGCMTVNVGKKMPKTNFYFEAKAKNNSEFAHDSNYTFVFMCALALDYMGAYDLSAVGNYRPFISAFSVKDNDSGTITSKDAGHVQISGEHLRNGGVSDFRPNTFAIHRKADDTFEVVFGNSNALYKWPSTVTYDYKLVYFGDNPSADIIDLS